MPVMSDAAPRPPTTQGRTSFFASPSEPGVLAAAPVELEVAPPEVDAEKLAPPPPLAWFVVVVDTGTLSSADATEAEVTAIASTASDRAVFIIAAEYRDWDAPRPAFSRAEGGGLVEHREGLPEREKEGHR